MFVGGDWDEFFRVMFFLSAVGGLALVVLAGYLLYLLITHIVFV